MNGNPQEKKGQDSSVNTNCTIAIKKKHVTVVYYMETWVRMRSAWSMLGLEERQRDKNGGGGCEVGVCCRTVDKETFCRVYKDVFQLFLNF